MNHHGTLNDILRLLVKKGISVASIEDKKTKGIHIVLPDTNRIIWWRGLNDEKVEIADTDLKKKLGWYFTPKSSFWSKYWYNHGEKINFSIGVLGFIFTTIGLYLTIFPIKKTEPNKALEPTTMDVTPLAAQESRQP